MSSRNLRARLDRLAQAIGEQKAEAPTCRFHGQHCRMGANWPLKYVEGPLDDLLDIRAAGRRRLGLEVEAHPRDLWAVDAHDLVPPAELARERREVEDLLAGLRAQNDQIVAELRGERAATGGIEG
jgi:hypothetical protein